MSPGDHPERTAGLPEWRGGRLTYLSPAETLRRFGYGFDGVDIEYRRSCAERVERQDGPVADLVEPFDDAEAATEFVTSLARRLGADDVGSAALDEAYVYRGASLDPFVVVIAVSMEYSEFGGAPDARCHTEVWRAYDRAGEIAVGVAGRLRERGYRARAHTVKGEELALIPHAVAAGMGELGKHGSLIHPELGPTFRLAAVTTDLELTPDEPRPFGVDQFCSRCRLCVEWCPGDAISHDKAVVRGTERWVVDTGACAPFMASHEACAVCLAVCPYNAKTGTEAELDIFRSYVRSQRPHELKATLERHMQEPWSLVQAPP